MKRIFYTQRVEAVSSYRERRDCTDQRLPAFLSACGFLPVPVPNIPDLAKKLCTELFPEGVFLTGGNSLGKYGGDAPERDETERVLLEWAIEKKVPVFGVCRGLQFVADFFGSQLEMIGGHVRTRHPVSGEVARDSVNSYHEFGLMAAKVPLLVAGKAPDGSTEAVRHESLPIAAIGWHPERETPFCEDDIAMVREWFG